MKKILLLGLTALMITGCGGSKTFNTEEFRKEYAIKSYNDVNFDLNKTTINGNVNRYGDYYYQDNTFKSIFNNKSIDSTDLSTKTYYDLVIHYDYYSKNCYDSFGNNLPFKINEIDYYDVERYIYFAAEDSSLYKNLSKVESKNHDLHLLNVYKFSSYYIFTESGDTHFDASNVYYEHDSKISNVRNGLIDYTSNVEALNEEEYLVENSDGIYHYVYQYNDDSYEGNEWYNNNVNKFREVDGAEEDFYSIMSIRFAGTPYTYDYMIKRVYGITNDFTFVLDGDKYYAKVKSNYSSVPVDFFPVEYMMSNYSDYALVLCKKIDEDGNLSNKYYMFKLDSQGNKSEYSEDISIFSDTSTYIYFNNQYILLSDKKLITLRDDLYLVKSNTYGSYQLVTRNGSTTIGYSGDYRILASYSINSLFIFLSDSEIYLYDSYGSSRSRYYDRMINEYFCLYETSQNELYILDEMVTSSSNYSTSTNAYMMFGEYNMSLTVKVYDDYYSSTTYIYSLNSN